MERFCEQCPPILLSLSYTALQCWFHAAALRALVLKRTKRVVKIIHPPYIYEFSFCHGISSLRYRSNGEQGFYQWATSVSAKGLCICLDFLTWSELYRGDLVCLPARSRDTITVSHLRDSSLVDESAQKSRSPCYLAS